MLRVASSVGSGGSSAAAAACAATSTLGRSLPVALAGAGSARRGLATGGYEPSMDKVVTMDVPLGVPHTGTLIWLHGLGDSSEGFRPLFEFVNPHERAGIRVVLPNAPVRPVTLNNGFPSSAWYDITTLDNRTAETIGDLARGEDTEGVETSRLFIDEVIAREAKATDAIAIGGFSQGGAMAAYAGLGAKTRLAGVASICGYGIGLSNYPANLERGQNADQQLALWQGGRDPMVAFAWANRTWEHLRDEHGVDYVMRVAEQGEHTLYAEQVNELSAWIEGVFDVGGGKSDPVLNRVQ